MKLLDVKRDSEFLYIETDEGTFQQISTWRGSEAVEAKCRSLIGKIIRHTTYGDWDPKIWFSDVFEEDSEADKNHESNLLMGKYPIAFTTEAMAANCIAMLNDWANRQLQRKEKDLIRLHENHIDF